MIEVLSTLFSYSFMMRALLAGALVALCAALLGVSLVLRFAERFLAFRASGIL